MAKTSQKSNTSGLTLTWDVFKLLNIVHHMPENNRLTLTWDVFK